MLLNIDITILGPSKINGTLTNQQMIKEQRNVKEKIDAVP